MVLAFIGCVQFSDEELKMFHIGFDSWMCAIFCKRVWFPLLDAVVDLVYEAGVENMVGRTRYSPVRAHITVVQSDNVALDHHDCPGWYGYDNRLPMREIPPKCLGGRT